MATPKQYPSPNTPIVNETQDEKQFIAFDEIIDSRVTATAAPGGAGQRRQVVVLTYS